MPRESFRFWCSRAFHSWRDAIIVAMRFRPDLIVVGEVHDGSAFEVLKAWNTGTVARAVWRGEGDVRVASRGPGRGHEGRSVLLRHRSRGGAHVMGPPLQTGSHRAWGAP